NSNDPEASVWSVRCRSTKTDANGMPGMSSPDGSVTGRLAHLTYTRSAAGQEQLYLDGSPVAGGPHEGDFRTWDESYRLLLGNELSKDRAWLGELRLVAVYARALTPAEVQRNFLARTD
ncbi:MAG TPA: LamG-like jellyroll fold domain-containing protein, partial [Planctomycetota bacterium]|nr:LamG-like jellyroll fold domain-containing protein [Planctomycetota bacterium]